MNNPKQIFQRLALTWRLLLIIFFSVFFGFVAITIVSAVLVFKSDRDIEGEYVIKLMKEYEQRVDTAASDEQAEALFDLYSLRVQMYRQSASVLFQMDSVDHSKPYKVIRGVNNDEIFAMRFNKEKGFLEENLWKSGGWIVIYHYMEQYNQVFALYVRNNNFYRKSDEYNHSYIRYLMAIWLLLVTIIAISLFKTLRPIEKRVREQERIAGELQIAHRIQMMMLPEAKCYHLDSFFQPARETGGDFFYYVQLKDRMLFIIADVSGKGIPASLVMAMNVSRFRLLASQKLDPKQIIETMNREMLNNNSDGQFMTAFVGSITRHGGELTFCNAGHNAPVIVGCDAQFMDVKPNLPLGVIADYEYEQQFIQLPEGASLFCYTDGLNEAVDENGNFFGNDRILSALTNVPPDKMIETMMAQVHRFSGKAPQEDDLTLLCIEANQPNVISFESIEQTAQLHSFLDHFFQSEALDVVPGVELAIEELLVNALQYSGSTSVQLKGEVQEQQLVFTLTDNGTPFNPLNAPQADTSASVEDRQIGGLGILLATELMDKISYNRINNQNIVILCKSIINKPMVS